MTRLDPQLRRRLRTVLVETAPWLANPDRGPSSVAAGECGRCDRRPRLVTTCGPGAPEAELCGPCAVEVGVDAWCDGHVDDAEALLAWIATLPDDWPALARLWWVATGEIGLDPALLGPGRPAELLRRAGHPGA